ncbi:MAG TPA: endonuclease domain-containing protein [Sphingomicrobium sp.]|nr:endonuclease domain-containing protein [Sphingomicrobium sp.]
MLRSTRRNIKRARSLRRKMSLPEVLLWQRLRRRPEGLKFRRQHPAGPYVLDFYCESARVCIEVDGAAHGMGDGPASDQRRDTYLRNGGIRTLRIAARDVIDNLDGALQLIVRECRATPLHQTASPSGPPPLQGGY